MHHALTFLLTLLVSPIAGVSAMANHANRLDTETITASGGSAVTTDYDYDLADNRITKTVGSSVTVYQFGNGNNGANSNQLKSYGPSGQAFTYSFDYDLNGNRSYRFGNSLTDIDGWDDENRLSSIQIEGATTIAPPGEEGSFAPPAEGSAFHYTYDHRGRRVVRDESAAGGVLTELTFSGGTSVQEANSSGTVQVELIRNGTRSYNAYNSRGDVVSVTDGTATWQAAYEAFGTRTQEDGTNDERQRANTKDEDPTGLLNEGHRYRDLEAGVFISRDPLGFVDGPNVYAYVAQNPWSRFAPEGLAPQIINTLASMGDDWFGYWGGVGTAAGNAAKGLGHLAMNLDPATNAWQGFAGKQTSYQKIAAGVQQACHNYVQAAENLGANAQMNGRTMVAWEYGSYALNTAPL